MSDKAMPLADARKDALKDTAARRRIAALFDPDTFVEVGALVKNGCDGAGVITGYGLVDGSPVYTFAQDTSVRNGAVGAAHGSKIKKIYELALKSGAPVVGIYDSNGAAIDEGLDAMAAYGDMLCWTNNLSGVVPQVSVVLGPCAGCAAMIAASADFVVASEQAELFLAPGDEACDAKNAALSGVAHLVEKDEAAAVAAARRLIALLPSNNLSALPLCEFREADKAAAALEAAAKAMDKADMMKIIDSVADAGSVIELQKDFTKCGVHVALGTVAGSTVGFVAASDSGKVCSNGSSKIARFVAICDSFQIPVVTFVNCAGFAATNGHAFRGGVREVAKLAHVYAEATTPKIAVICGAAYGSAYVALAGRGANADYAVAWPDAVISALSPATAVAFMEGDKITKDKTRAQVEAEYAANEAGAVAAAAKGHIDDVVDPADTRAAVVSAIDMLIGKRVSRLPKKHANIPM
ncbi:MULTISPECIES: carboxyl transferase domain-containing protein [Anaerotruncus]|jgi:acetyl-CoA carboxylase carboxyltransferase component|uniref:Carboxyl transferase n=1 Tax=Anaerotruncus colihominis TaxID=169435 RepID=A0A845SUG9_9FIRM|nr:MULTISPECIES: carboxyl transferase domain-containing protein [Anaerotruncus]MCI8492034.1 carboxyl transferase [Anaerotruncus sp.]MCR2025439.1 carboxyl transferase [Anaerotruncus colihominis]NDO37934.1 carboxyl transferase [Anaerotruncus colihominis]